MAISPMQLSAAGDKAVIDNAEKYIDSELHAGRSKNIRVMGLSESQAAQVAARFNAVGWNTQYHGDGGRTPSMIFNLS